MIEHDLQYAIELARAAGKIVLEQYGKVARLTKTHIAASEEAVTDADRASQRLIVAGLKKRFPTDGESSAKKAFRYAGNPLRLIPPILPAETG